jgi:hypothetical protein
MISKPKFDSHSPISFWPHSSTFETNSEMLPHNCGLNLLLVFMKQLSVIWFSIMRFSRGPVEDFSSTGNGNIQEPNL